MGLKTMTRVHVYVSSSSSLVLMNADAYLKVAPQLPRTCSTSGAHTGASVETRPYAVLQTTISDIRIFGKARIKQ